MAIESDPVPRGPVRASLNFYGGTADGSIPYNIIPESGDTTRNFEDDTREVTVTDIRGNEDSFTLDKDAFKIVRGVPPSAETSFTDDESIKAKFYPEVEALLLEHIPGSYKVVFFDHTIRRADPKAPRGPVMRVHIDQTLKSVTQRIRRHLPDEADKLLAGRYRLVNVWRPLNKGPVETSPLAFASSSTLRDDDVIPVEHRYKSGYTGETAAIRHNPEQRFYYLSGITGDERILLECFDSEALRENSGVSGGRVPHTAFLDHRSRPEAEGRESIEVRALVFGP